MSQENNTKEVFDNNKQAVDIKGYRVLSDTEKGAINLLKQNESIVLSLIDSLKHIPDVNERSLELGIQNIQTGFMWAIRAVARPNGE